MIGDENDSNAFKSVSIGLVYKILFNLIVLDVIERY